MNIKTFEDKIKKDFSGVISITSNGKTVLKSAYGYSDIANQIPNQVDTKFPIASGSKIFVAVGILQLIENGKISFETCIGDVLDFDLKEINSKITIRQLLNHTSGIPDYFDEKIMNDYEELWADYPNYKIRNSSDLLPLFINKPMINIPGTKFKYNNAGYIVLGLIIEKVAGQKFDEYLKNNIFTPCKMESTGYYELDKLPEKCANAYIFDKSGNFRTNIYSVDVKGTGAGGAFVTVDDMRKFWNTLLNDKLISKEFVDKMLFPQARDEKSIYGYGVWLCEKKENSYFYYVEGSDPGVSFLSFIDMDIGLVTTLISNYHNNVWKYREDILTLT